MLEKSPEIQEHELECAASREGRWVDPLESTRDMRGKRLPGLSRGNLNQISQKWGKGTQRDNFQEIDTALIWRDRVMNTESKFLTQDFPVEIKCREKMERRL